MSSEQMQWITVYDNLSSKPIGAVGLLVQEDGSQRVAVIATYYDDYDANYDGSVSLKEKVVGKIFPISLKGKELAKVAMQARLETDVLEKDPTFPKEAASIFVKFGTSMALDAVYATYLKTSVGRAAGGIAGQIVTGGAKQFFIRKGMEAAIKKAYDMGFKNTVLHQR